MATPEQNKAIVRRFDELIRDGNPDGLSAALYGRHGQPCARREQTERSRRDTGVPDRVEAIWPGGTFRGMDTACGPYTTDAAFMYRLVDDRIAERWAVRDDLGMLRQLGALG
jgi:hypothetical protein